jgi:hypothetical protein
MHAMLVKPQGGVTLVADVARSTLVAKHSNRQSGLGDVELGRLRNPQQGEPLMATPDPRLLGRAKTASGKRAGTHAGQAGPLGTGPSHPQATTAEMKEVQYLALDLVQLAFDLAGLVDPTPVSDGASALIALGRGQWFDVLISGASMIPYLGDLAKAGKLPKYAKTLQRALALGRRSEKCAQVLLPIMRKLDNTLDLFPRGANHTLDEMHDTVRAFCAEHRTGQAVKHLPDISRRFRFREWEAGGRTYKQASGRLGRPGAVKTHRSKSAQSKVSSGTGDHAGHLIGDRFGAPGDMRNLSPQNWKSNQGSYKDLEDRWAKTLKEGGDVHVEVTDVTRKGEDRPFMRRVEWTEITPEGKRTKQTLDFANTHTPQSRQKQGIEPSVSSPQTNNVTHVDFVEKKIIQ